MTEQVSPGDAAAGEDDDRHRGPGAWIVDADGTRVPVQAGKMHGLEEFAAAWRSNVAEPESMHFEGWQQCDDTHPAGEGAPAYRIVFKTIRLVTFPPIDFAAPNLRIRLGTGPVNRGGPRFVNTLASVTRDGSSSPSGGASSRRRRARPATRSTQT